MNRYKTLIKDIGILALGNFGSKFLAFLLIPLYTSVLTTEEYGEYDIIYTTISLLVPILTINISEGALRFLLEKKNNTHKIIQIAYKYIVLSTAIVTLLLSINKLINGIPLFNNFSLLFVLLYISFSFYQTEQNITRGLDHLKRIGISGLINTAFMLTLNILFLLYFKLGIYGFFAANIISYLIAAIYLFASNKTYAFIKNKEKDTNLEKNLITYSRPMMLNSISWWVNSVSDRYIVSLICGAAANGVYSMAYKIPTILTMVQSIFNQAWTVSSAKMYDKDDKDGFFSNIYTWYNLALTLACSLLIISSKVLADLLYKNEFYEAWKYMPYLLISVIFSSLAGVLSGIFVSVKDSKSIGLTSFFGAVINIVLNILLISTIGPIGAAIATLISSFSIWAIRYKRAKAYISLKRIKVARDIVGYICLFTQAIMMIYSPDYLAYPICSLLTLIILCLNTCDLKSFYGYIKQGERK